MPNKISNKIWKPKEDVFLKKHYSENILIEELVKGMKRTEWSIISRASFLKIKKIKKVKRTSKYDLNLNYFSSIDNHEKAYWYGFLWADGSVYKGVLELALQSRDLYIIEKFKQVLESTHPIKKHYKYEVYRFIIASMELIESLREVNITERKSYSKLVPLVSDEFFFSFLAGIFDGDGTVTSGCFNLTTSPEVAEWLQNNLIRLLNIKTVIYIIPNVHAVRFNSNRQLESLNLFYHMYKDISFCLRRKVEKIIKFYENRPLKNSEFFISIKKFNDDLENQFPDSLRTL